jgi:branched-chain amino acid transport system substrate-binding protein
MKPETKHSELIAPTLSAQWRAQRRSLIKSAGIAAATPFFISHAFAQQAVKIGIVLAKQGPFAQQGSDLSKGIQIAFDEASRQVLGRPAELVWLDEPNPQVAVQSITKAIDEQKVIAVLGGTSSANSLAMGAAALQRRVPFISVNGSAREITGKDCNPFMFRMPASIPVYARAMAPHMLAIGKKWYFIAGSFAFGEDVVSTFSEILTAAGGTVVGIDRAPVATTDYSSFMLKARAAKPDIIVSGAANVEPILKQVRELGMGGSVQVAGPAVSDTDLWSATPEALTGIYGKSWYFNDPANSPEEKAFVAKYRAAEGKPPSDRAFFGWQSMRLLLAAVEQAKSVDPVAVTRGLTGFRLNDGSLPMSFREWDHQLMRRVVVGTAKANPADKWDVVQVKSQRPVNAAELDRLYGDKVEIGCRMAAI